MSTYGLYPDQVYHYQLKFTNLQKDRERLRKDSDLDDLNDMLSCVFAKDKDPFQKAMI